MHQQGGKIHSQDVARAPSMHARCRMGTAAAHHNVRNKQLVGAPSRRVGRLGCKPVRMRSNAFTLHNAFECVHTTQCEGRQTMEGTKRKLF
jgi:hypothetical protein